jgi:hypothetical protein
LRNTVLFLQCFELIRSNRAIQGFALSEFDSFQASNLLGIDDIGIDPISMVMSLLHLDG